MTIDETFPSLTKESVCQLFFIRIIEEDDVTHQDGEVNYMQLLLQLF